MPLSVTIYSSLSAQNVFEEEGGERACSFSAKAMPFRPGGKETSHLCDVTEASSRRHEHGVNVRFAEEGSGNGDSRRNPDFGSLAELALMSGIDILSDIVNNRRPPKAI